MLRRFFINRSIFFALFLVMAAVLPAVAEDAFVITSESLQADRKARSAVFQGSVVARSGNMVLIADRMTASYGEDGSLSTLVAEGSVKMVKGLQVLTSQRAVYDLAARNILFTGEPRAVEEGNVLTGDTISYYLDEDRIKVEKSTMFIEDPGAGAADE